MLLLKYWLYSYLFHTTVYILSVFTIDYINKHFLASAKIQQREPKPGSKKRDIIQSFKSFIPTSFFLASGIYLQSIGCTWWTPVQLNIYNFIWTFALSMLLQDTWFYWGHRLAHYKKLHKHKHGHKWHHKSVTPRPWSSNSETIFDACALHSYYLFVIFIFPIPATVLIIYKLYDIVEGVIGHAGYEYGSITLSKWPAPFTSVTYHDIHHSKFKYNFASHFTWWDRMMGTIDPDYDETFLRIINSKYQGSIKQSEA